VGGPSAARASRASAQSDSLHAAHVFCVCMNSQRRCHSPRAFAAQRSALCAVQRWYGSQGGAVWPGPACNLPTLHAPPGSGAPGAAAHAPGAARRAERGACARRSPHYKALVKALVRAALGPVDVQTAKDVETCLAGVRSDKVKEEAAAKLAKKGVPPPLHSALTFTPYFFSPAIQPRCASRVVPASCEAFHIFVLSTVRQACFT